MLKIEFSQVDDARDGGLTLVIDADHGAACKTYCTLSRRRRPEAAVRDLRYREEVPEKEIGFVSLPTLQCRGRDAAYIRTTALWAKRRRIDVAIWTDSPSNFKRRCHRPFSVAAAVAHIQALSPQAKADVAEYVWLAQKTVDTPLRRALQRPPWFAPR